MREAGIFCSGFTMGHRHRMARASAPTPAAAQFTVGKARTTSSSFSMVSTGARVKVRPKKSLS